MPFIYIGRRHSFIGKSIFEICASIKNFGIGRLLIRQRYKRYEEPCFLRIVECEPEMDAENLHGRVIVDYVFRGQQRGLVDLSRVAYKTDYQLIPKHEEDKYIKALENFKLKNVKIYSPVAEMPPLLKLIAEKKNHHKTHFEFKLKGPNMRTRVAEPGETPNAVAHPGLGEPLCKRLYEGAL